MIDTSKSVRGTLTLWDWIKGGIISAGTGLVTSIVDILNTYFTHPGQSITFDTFKPSLLAAGSVFLVYILKQLGTNSDGEIAKEKN